MKPIIVTLLAVTLLAAVAALPATAAPPRKTPKKSAPVPSREEPANPYTILSIIPSQGEPGKRVSLMGAGFSADTQAWLGVMSVPTTVVSDRQLEFEIPRVDPGLYALYLRRPDGATSKSYNFPVLAPRPAIDAITPDTVYGCAPDQERLTVISGRNFQEHSAVLFDGAAIRSNYGSPEALSFTVPPNVLGGQHNIQVKNPDDTVSGTVAFYVDMKPSLRAVTTGEERVNSYELILEGHNFQQGSAVMVDGNRIYNGIDRDRVRFVNCTRLVYERFPWDRSTKSIRIQVINPNGEESQVMTVSAP